jgi:hypothetical protein
VTVELRPMGALPFCKGTVLLPRHRRSALAGMALAAPSRPPVVHVHRALNVIVHALGARWLPGASRSVWPEWLGTEGAEHLIEDIARSLGPFDAVALHVPRQPGRRSLAMVVVSAGEARAFVKAKPDAAALALEGAALAALSEGPSGGLHIARPIACGSAHGVEWLATTVVEGRHLPTFGEPGPEYEEWLGERLGPVLRDGAPAHWTPAHGDLAPWNLRRRAGLTWLLDWENVGWAPPGADRTYFRAARAVLLREGPQTAPAEAVDYWIAKVERRAEGGDPLNRRLLEVLPRMRDARDRA